MEIGTVCFFEDSVFVSIEINKVYYLFIFIQHQNAYNIAF